MLVGPKEISSFRANGEYREPVEPLSSRRRDRRTIGSHRRGVSRVRSANGAFLFVASSVSAPRGATCVEIPREKVVACGLSIAESPARRKWTRRRAFLLVTLDHEGLRPLRVPCFRSGAPRYCRRIRRRVWSTFAGIGDIDYRGPGTPGNG